MSVNVDIRQHGSRVNQPRRPSAGVGTRKGGHERPTNGLETVGHTAKADTSLERLRVASTVADITRRLGGTIHFVPVAKFLPTPKELGLAPRR
jgi:hypothetical protein